MAFVLVACPYCANMQHIYGGLKNPFCAFCGRQFTATPISKLSNVDQINEQGYALIHANYSIAEDLFLCALKLNPDDFAALIGVALTHQIRIETIAFDKKTVMAIGFYLLTKQKSGRWRLLPEDAEAAERYCAYLDAAIEHAPDEEAKHKLELYRKHNIIDAQIQMDNVIHGRVS